MRIRSAAVLCRLRRRHEACRARSATARGRRRARPGRDGTVAGPRRLSGDPAGSRLSPAQVSKVTLPLPRAARDTPDTIPQSPPPARRPPLPRQDARSARTTPGRRRTHRSVRRAGAGRPAAPRSALARASVPGPGAAVATGSPSSNPRGTICMCSAGNERGGCGIGSRGGRPWGNDSGLGGVGNRSTRYPHGASHTSAWLTPTRRLR